MDDLLKKRFLELAGKCYNKGIYTNTAFLSMAEADGFLCVQKEVSHVPFTLFGGYEGAERKVLRFGDADSLGYEEEFPVTRLEVTPLMEKFSDDLTHRDFLGALMNLGIDRSLIGDIIVYGPKTDKKSEPGGAEKPEAAPAGAGVRNTRADVYCMTRIAEFICDELTRIKHTSVQCRIAESLEPEGAQKEPQTKEFSVSSLRADAVICKVYNLSRSAAESFFAAQKVFINQRIEDSPGRQLKPGDTVTVRGRGRFVFEGCDRVNKKGKNCVTVRI